MAYSVRARFDTGFTTVYALIQSLEFGAGTWWNNSTQHWDTPTDGMLDDTTPADGSFITLTESGTEKGIYTGIFTNLAPIKGTIYRIWVMDGSGGKVRPDADGVYFRMSEVPYSVGSLTALEIINRVQRRLRLPASSAITDTHAQLMLDFVNDAYLTVFPNIGVMNELKVRGAFFAHGGGPTLWPIHPINFSYVSKLNWVKYYGKSPDEYPLELVSAETLEIENLKAMTSGDLPGYAKFYCIRQSPDRFPVVQLYPDPDPGVAFEYECSIKPSALSAATDYPICDPMALLYGATILAKRDAGLDPSAEVELLGNLIGTMDFNTDHFASQEIDC